MKNLFVKLSVVMLTLLGVYCFGMIPAHAQQTNEYSVTQPSLLVTLQENNTAQLKQTFTLTNNSADGKIFNSYTLVIPFINIKNISVSANNSQLNATPTESRVLGITELKITLAQPLLPAQSYTLEINYELENYIFQSNNTRFFLFGNPSVTDREKYTNIILKIPHSYGNITQTSLASVNESEKDEIYTSYSLSNPDEVFYILWGNSYTLQLKQESLLTNINSQEITSLYQLIPPSITQDIYYNSEIVNTQYGLRDSLGNVFASVYLQPAEEKLVSYDATVTKTYSPLEEVQVRNNLPFELINGVFLQKIIPFLNKQNSKKSFEDIYKLLIQEYTATTMATDFGTNEQFWNRIQSSTELSSFEFCGILSAVAKHLQIPSTIRYGYLSFYPNTLRERSPHFWCVFEIDGQKKLYDPFLHNAVGINYAGLLSEFDRITVGVWEPHITTYTTSLGLAADINEIQQVEVRHVLSEQSTVMQDNIDLNLQLQDKVYAGLYFTADIHIKNDTNMLLPVKKVYFNSIDVTESLVLPQNIFSLVVLPHQTTPIQVEYVREPNFLHGGNRPIEFIIEFDNDAYSHLQKTVTVEFSINLVAILIGICIIFTLIALIVVLIYFVYKRKLYAIRQ